MATVVKAQVMQAAPMCETIQVQKSRMVSRIIEVPVQKTITVMEQRTIQEQEFYFEEEVVPMQMQMQCLYETAIVEQPVEMYVTRKRKVGWWLGKMLGRPQTMSARYRNMSTGSDHSMH